jgi:hypothetical protein
LARYVRESYDEELVPECHRDDLDNAFAGSAFLGWFFFNWIPSGLAGPAGAADRRWPVALAFLEEHGESLPPDTVAVILAHTKQAWGLWSVTDVRPAGSSTSRTSSARSG